jgi:hypothetical protein
LEEVGFRRIQLYLNALSNARAAIGKSRISIRMDGPERIARMDFIRLWLYRGGSGLGLRKF